MGHLTLPPQPATLAAIVFALREGLIRTATTLAAHHDNQPGQWLDDLESDCVHAIKISTTDAPIEDEASIMKDAITVLEFVFEEIRRDLASK